MLWLVTLVAVVIGWQVNRAAFIRRAREEAMRRKVEADRWHEQRLVNYRERMTLAAEIEAKLRQKDEEIEVLRKELAR